jgi:hypothetical protein
MKRYKRISVFFFGILVLLWAMACGGTATPVSMGDIPVYPGATSAEAGEGTLVGIVIDTMEETAGTEDINLESKVYALPADATWSDVKSFYTDEIADTDWKATEEFAQETEGFSSIGWERGSGANEQVLVIALVTDPLEGGTFVIIMLFSSK